MGFDGLCFKWKAVKLSVYKMVTQRQFCHMSHFTPSVKLPPHKLAFFHMKATTYLEKQAYSTSRTISQTQKLFSSYKGTNFSHPKVTNKPPKPHQKPTKPHQNPPRNPTSGQQPTCMSSFSWLTSSLSSSPSSASRPLVLLWDGGLFGGEISHFDCFWGFWKTFLVFWLTNVEGLGVFWGFF